MLSLIKKLTSQLNSLCRKELRDVEQASAVTRSGTNRNASTRPLAALV
jgi:hypothetical protein